VTDVIGSEHSLDRFAHLHQPIDDPADHRWLAVSVDSSECSRFGSPIDLVRRYIFFPDEPWVQSAPTLPSTVRTKLCRVPSRLVGIGIANFRRCRTCTHGRSMSNTLSGSMLGLRDHGRSPEEP
jgi:hypothetical protein